MADMDKHPALMKAAELVRNHLCQEMLDTQPGTKEKEAAKARYMAFCYVSITARAGREQDEGLTQLAKDLAEREANLEAEVQKAVNEALAQAGKRRADIPFEHPMPEAAAAVEELVRPSGGRTRAPVVTVTAESPKRQRAQAVTEGPAKRQRRPVA
jgi:hypothetical protein